MHLRSGISLMSVPAHVYSGGRVFAADGVNGRPGWTATIPARATATAST
jgi:hypothetical protein